MRRLRAGVEAVCLAFQMDMPAVIVAPAMRDLLALFTANDLPIFYRYHDIMRGAAKVLAAG